MPRFTVTLKRVVYAQVDIEASSAAEARRLVKEGDNSLDYFSTSENIWGDDIKAVKVEPKPQEPKS